MKKINKLNIDPKKPTYNFFFIILLLNIYITQWKPVSSKNINQESLFFNHVNAEIKKIVVFKPPDHLYTDFK